MTLKLTPSGVQLLLRAIAGEEPINFRVIQYGNGDDAGDSASALSNPMLTLEITAAAEQGDFYVLTAVFNNSTVQTGFSAREIGILADDPDVEGATLLYAYGYAPAEESDYIPASTERLLETQTDIMVYIGAAEEVTATISSALDYASHAELEAHTGNQSNPHVVTKEQVGLGNVPNVATNDQTPTWTAPSAITEPTSGETLSTILGKLARAVSGLIAHIANTENPHAVRYNQTGAAAANHTHSTANITSGVLSQARGGTGNANGQAATALRLATARNFQVDFNAASPTRSFDGSGEMKHIPVTGVLPVENGGTGQTGLAALRAAMGLDTDIAARLPKSGGSDDAMTGDLYIFGDTPTVVLYGDSNGRATVSYSKADHCVRIQALNQIGGVPQPAQCGLVLKPYTGGGTPEGLLQLWTRETAAGTVTYYNVKLELAS